MESGCFGPSLESLEHLINDVQYHTFNMSNVTVCFLALKDGKGLIGESALLGDEFTLAKNEAAALQDALVKLIRHDLNSKHHGDSERVSSVNCVPIKAVDDTKHN
ncbi:hypothetical protein [Thiolapillus sp.]|uniref:hypothetical protein n=1 Tax=Thiolapillus sp. TaxID=2017437 RepID=UPI003AF8E0C6